MKLKKALLFSDIHFGRKQNSETHNLDCYKFIQTIVEHIKKDKSIDHIIFLGDWHEHRQSINGLTLKFSYDSAKLLDSINIPVFFITGNHDLYFRNKREIATTLFFDALNNFTIVDEKPIIVNDTIIPILICPFLFPEEYKDLIKYNNIPVWFGHFEFKGFVVTGDTYKLDHGPEHETFSNVSKIFSGHFHKRQNEDNVFYIGNTFPMDFSDANDEERGYAIFEYSTQNLEYFKWKEAPSYIKTKLSSLLKNHKNILKELATVRCLVDVDINLEESIAIKDNLMKKYNLREFSLEESSDEIVIDDINIEGMELESVDFIIKELLKKVDSKKLNTDKLVKIYEGIKL